MKILLLLPGLVLAGCAATPEQMAQRSNWDVCRFTMGGPHSLVAQHEAQRRGLDCAPLYPAIAAKLQAENAATANLINALQRPSPPPRQPISCSSHRAGNSVHTNCF